MNTLRRELLVWVQLVALVLIWVLVLVCSDVDLKLDWEAFKKLPDAMGIYLVLLVVFRQWAWRWPVFRNWLVQVPDLQGTWKGTIRSSWTDPTTGAAIPAKSVVLVIRQTFSSVSCVMYSGESDSFSTTAQIYQDDESGMFRLSYNYLNRPRAGVRDRSEIHDGAAILKIVSSPTKELSGEYWTSRKTTGDIAVSFATRELTQKYE